ncbi:PLC-like phosphodiesterase, partial [Aureobasidium melanogenum]
MDNSTNYGSIAEKGELYHAPPTRKEGALPHLADWMCFLPDDMPISALSIPGTHDSAAFMSTWPFVATQTLTTAQQLDAGIRYFDLRCGIIKDEVQMVHGRAVLGLKLSDLLTSMYTFLQKHPKEAIIIQLKQDRKDEASTRPFSQLVLNLMREHSKYWRLETTTPTLGELRGRIQLLRRFSTFQHQQFTTGIDVTRWPDNPPLPFTVRTRVGVHLTIQDHYSFSTPENLSSLVAKKGGDVASMLMRASRDTEPWHWYINFSSAFEFNIYYQIPPKDIAIGGYSVFRWVEGINLRLCNFLKQRLDDVDEPQRFGVVVMDFVEKPAPDLVKTVIEANFVVPGKRRGGQARHQLPFPFSNQDNSTPAPLLLTQGAEALVYRTTFLTPSTACALKYRPAKPWRHRTLDMRLTRQRILAEARVLTRCRREGVAVPAVLGLDWERGWLAQEWIYGNTVRKVLDWVHKESGLSDSEKEQQVHDLLRRIGSALGRLHERGLVHGDLTTSNLMLRPSESDIHDEDKQVGKAIRVVNTNGEIVLIDFGLAQQTVQEEDKAVDLYVLERAFASTHPEVED